MLIGEIVARVGDRDEVRAERARSLVQQLMEGVLAVGLFAAPDYGCGGDP